MAAARRRVAGRKFRPRVLPATRVRVVLRNHSNLVLLLLLLLLLIDVISRRAALRGAAMPGCPLAPSRDPHARACRPAPSEGEPGPESPPQARSPLDPFGHAANSTPANFRP